MNRTEFNARHGEAMSADAVRFERLLPGPIERVWAYLVETDKRKTWFTSGEIEPRVGGKVLLVFNHSQFAEEPTPERYAEMDEGGMKMESRVIRWEPPTLLAITWPEGGHESEVTFHLQPEGEHVRLRLTHSKIAGNAQRIDVSGGWHAHLAVLANVLEGKAAGPFWSRIEPLEEQYRRMFDARD